jgi:hypothetical protein
MINQPLLRYYLLRQTNIRIVWISVYQTSSLFFTVSDGKFLYKALKHIGALFHPAHLLRHVVSAGGYILG